MVSQHSPIDQISQFIGRLPGLGPRSAKRITLALLQRREQLIEPFVLLLQKLQREVVTCTTCGNFDSQNPCAICANANRKRQLCVVETVADLWAIEKAQVYFGHYHVLGGMLSALQGVMPEDLPLDALWKRVAAGGYDEVILGLNPSVEGQTTAFYIAERLKQYAVPVSRLTIGVPIGGTLEYLDEGTLTVALQNRQAA